MTPLDETTKNQRKAAHPDLSAFVLANAGSGKTRVLTNRVARLLLAGTPPQKILCITFTKAAAAEMSDRLFEVLGEWALMDDSALTETLHELEGKEGKKRSKEELVQVRRLFARALETPGGLKIQTIHAFCENVLRRFPLEAGAPPGFTVLEDDEGKQLLNDAIDRVAKKALHDEPLHGDLRTLSRLYGESDLRDLLAGAAGNGFTVAAAKEYFGDIEGVLSALSAALGADRNTSAEEIKTAFLNTIDDADMQRAHDALAASGGNPAKFAVHVKDYLNSKNASDRWSALVSLFFISDGVSPRKQIVTKATDSHDPWARTYLESFQQECIEVLERLKAQTLYHDTAAFIRIVDIIGTLYAEAKASKAALDFNDLIVRTRTLFNDTDATWIMYKLDKGVDHILIDEAQDTSPAQWKVVEALFAEFLSGAGARDILRTFFAVGDMKQSIYSFQGADAGLFLQKEIDLGKSLVAVGDYERVDLPLSFRTTEPVLQFVDQLFREAEAAEGLGEFPVPTHGVHRMGEAGHVEIWPLTPHPESPEIVPWDAPVDTPSGDHPVRVLADRVAGTIKNWLDQGRMLKSQNRPVMPGDVMILVQSRGKIFNEVIERLARSGVPVAGADRLALLDDPAVEDLLSYAHFALSPEDDLSLAEILKSPFYGFDDDTDLFPLAHGRGDKQTLWGALNERANDNQKWKSARDEIALARAIARNRGPYAFFTHLLETCEPSGRKRFYERLTEAARDAIEELLRQALEYEHAHPRSLRGFVDWFERNAGIIKREMEKANNSVRIMTVHGAKGLEANIVFLIDAQREPVLKHLGPVFDIEGDKNIPLPVLVGASARDIPITAAARAEKKAKAYEEYRRLLYVAATRARDELYICGVESGKNKNPRDKPAGLKTWHALAQDALDCLGSDVKEAAEPFWAHSEEKARTFSCDQTKAVKQGKDAAAIEDVATPSWMIEPAAPETARPRVTPSQLLGEEDIGVPEAGAAYSPATGGDKYFRGRTLHRLLELLPGLNESARAEAADKLLVHLAPDIDAEERKRWRDETLAVLSDREFASVFGPGSRAEVAIAGVLKSKGDEITVSGQIDRLVIGEKKILVVDYKTNRPPPAKVENADPAYIAQLAAYRALLQEIYPGLEIGCALLWTYDARLMPVPDGLLDHAFSRAFKLA